MSIYGAETLKEIIDHLNEKIHPQKQKDTILKKITPQLPTKIEQTNEEILIDFSDIKGQEGAKRGLEIAAAGGHNIAMYGPPGTGKTLLAKAFAGILPPLSYQEMLDVTGIHSVAGTLKTVCIMQPPVRSPHHTASYVSIVGGGMIPKPGEITLAHRGVLFLDEFPEFDRKVIETLREPLEEGEIRISRSKGSTTFPANFILIAAMNPCPCGNFGSKTKSCVCRPQDLLRYERKISGPIVDRIDMWVEVSQIAYEKLAELDTGKKETPTLRKNVSQARMLQTKRFSQTKNRLHTNSDMHTKDITLFAMLSPKAQQILTTSAKHLDISARSYHRLIKLGRTIADLAKSESIEPAHILEALQYRKK